MSALAPTATDRTDRRWLVLVLVCIAQFMVVLDATVVNVALPSIQTDLGFSASSLQWVVNAYTLAFGGFLLLGGRAADFVGRRRLFVIGVVVFTAASLPERPGALVGVPDRGPRPPGPRRRDGLPGRPVDRDHHLPRGPRAHQGAQRVGRDRRRRRAPSACCSAAS